MRERKQLWIITVEEQKGKKYTFKVGQVSFSFYSYTNIFLKEIRLIYRFWCVRRARHINDNDGILLITH